MFALRWTQHRAGPMRTAAPISKQSFRLGRVSRLPLPRRLPTDSKLVRCADHTNLLDPLNQFLSLHQGQSGILVTVHPAPALGDMGVSTTPPSTTRAG